jgi:hypothetical protein
MTSAAIAAHAHDHASRVVYPPLDTLKQVAPELWIVDSGPMQAMGLPIPLRMTVVRLARGGLWLHSPTPLVPALADQLDRLGPVWHLVAPNVAHWSFVADWQRRYPQAVAWAAPGLRRRRAVRRSDVRFHHDLGVVPPPDWIAEIDQAVVPGGFGVHEVAFLHRPSRSLLLTDLVENFERSKVSPLLRPLVRLAGAMAPDGQAPAHLRFAINRRRQEAQAAARRLLDWGPERVIFAHGRWFVRDGTAQLRQSLRWLLA